MSSNSVLNFKKIYLLGINNVWLKTEKMKKEDTEKLPFLFSMWEKYKYYSMLI